MNKREIKNKDEKYEINDYEQIKSPISKILGFKRMEHSKIVSFLWEKQEFLRDHIKKNKRKDVILPFVILARLDAELDPTKFKVLDKIKELEKQGIKQGPGMDDDLNKITKKKFNNKSEFLNLSDLLTERHDIKSNLEDYVNGFSENIQDIFEHFKFTDVIKDLEKKKILWRAVEHFAGVTKELAKIVPSVTTDTWALRLTVFKLCSKMELRHARSHHREQRPVLATGNRLRCHHAGFVFAHRQAKTIVAIAEPGPGHLASGGHRPLPGNRHRPGAGPGPGDDRPA